MLAKDLKEYAGAKITAGTPPPTEKMSERLVETQACGHSITKVPSTPEFTANISFIGYLISQQHL